MVGVALEGGGARGAYHAGGIKALKDRGIKVSTYVGTSIGAINAAIACTNDINKLVKMWEQADNEMLFGIDGEVFQELLNKKITKENLSKAIEKSKQLIKTKGIKIDKIQNYLNEIIDEDKIRKSNIDFGLVTFNLSDKLPIKIFKKDIPKGKIVEYLIASSYLPVFKSTKIIDDKYYMDGGVYDNLPTDMLLEKNCDEIYAIRTKAIGITKRTKDKRIKYITPTAKLGSIMLFDPKNSKRLTKLGYYDTLKVIEKLDGYSYYIKPKNQKYYDDIIKKVSPYLLNKLRIEYKTLNNKIITIRLIEKIAKELNICNFKIYNINVLLLKIKLLIDEKNKYYKIISKLKIKLF